MKVYKVTMYLKLDDDSVPNKWVPDVIYDVLNSDEDLIDYHHEELVELNGGFYEKKDI